jgi:hypothetical protein
VREKAHWSDRATYAKQVVSLWPSSASARGMVKLGSIVRTDPFTGHAHLLLTLQLGVNGEDRPLYFRCSVLRLLPQNLRVDARHVAHVAVFIGALSCFEDVVARLLRVADDLKVDAQVEMGVE